MKNKVKVSWFEYQLKNNTFSFMYWNEEKKNIEKSHIWGEPDQVSSGVNKGEVKALINPFLVALFTP